MTARRRRLHAWTISRPPTCPAAARRICGCATAARSTTRSAPASRCCASIRTADADPIVRAAARRGVPLSVLDVQALQDASAYRHKLVLSRPDQHVAWRGNAPPANPDALIGKISGAALS